MTPEGVVKEELKDYLKSLGEDCWWFMPMSMGYGKRGVPDFVICYKGFFLAPETKRDGGRGQPWQEREQCAINKAGGFAGRVTDVATVKAWVAECDRKWGCNAL